MTVPVTMSVNMSRHMALRWVGTRGIVAWLLHGRIAHLRWLSRVCRLWCVSRLWLLINERIETYRIVRLRSKARLRCVTRLWRKAMLRRVSTHGLLHWLGHRSIAHLWDNGLHHWLNEYWRGIHRLWLSWVAWRSLSGISWLHFIY